MVAPVSRVLSKSQLATLAEHGEERTAAVGEELFRIGDETYPFIAILEGEAAVLDATGHEIVRHGASGFLGEMNLLSGQTVFLTAVVTEPMRYIAVERGKLRKLLLRGRAALRHPPLGLRPAARAAAAATGDRGRDRRRPRTRPRPGS